MAGTTQNIFDNCRNNTSGFHALSRHFSEMHEHGQDSHSPKRCLHPQYPAPPPPPDPKTALVDPTMPKGHVCSNRSLGVWYLICWTPSLNADHCVNQNFRSVCRAGHFLNFHAVALYGALDPELRCTEVFHLPSTGAQKPPLASAPIQHKELSQGIGETNHLQDTLGCAVQLGIPRRGRDV